MRKTIAQRLIESQTTRSFDVDNDLNQSQSQVAEAKSLIRSSYMNLGLENSVRAKQDVDEAINLLTRALQTLYKVSHSL